MRGTHLIVDQNAIAHNIRVLRGVSSTTPLMAVVKANAYGHNDIDTSITAVSSGCAALGVAIAEEGIRLREHGIDAPILIMGAPDPAAQQDVVAHGLIQTIFDINHARALDRIALKLGKPARIHIKLETGMHRIGANADELYRLLTYIKEETRFIHVEGLFTHLSSADSTQPDDVEYTLHQLDSLRKAVQSCQTLLDSLSKSAQSTQLPQDSLRHHNHNGLIIHAANSAAYLSYPQSRLNMARIGIAMYGAPPVDLAASFKPAMRWVTRAVRVHTIEATSCVGYGRTYHADGNITVMTMPVGYADGYHRMLSNNGYVLVHGKRAPIIGRVCMDQCMADVTGIAGAAVGDEVVLLGNQGDKTITADELGRWASTISYEVFCAISPRVPGVVIPYQPMVNNDDG